MLNLMLHYPHRRHGYLKVSTQERHTQLCDKLFHGVAFIAPVFAAEVAIKLR